MRNLWISAAFVCAASVLISLSMPAIAQEPVAMIETVGDVDLSKPGAVNGVVSRVSDQAAQEAVGKFLSGTVKIIQQGGKPAARIEWKTLANSPGSGINAPVPGLASTTQTGNVARIESGSRLIVSGSAAALIRAAGQLVETDPKSKEEETADDDSGSSRDSSGVDTSSVGGGNEANDNDLATPPTLQLSDSAVETVTVATDAYGTTREGCDPVLNEAGTEVLIMEAPTKNGVAVGPCVESLKTVPIESSYIGCDYDVREDDLEAFAKKKSYYTYGANTTPIDQDCVVDENAVFDITEEIGECPVVASIPELVATQYTKLQFLGRRNEINPVADCAKRNGVTFPIMFDTNECSMRDDFSNSVTWLRHRPMYQQTDGLLKPAGECIDSATFYVQTNDFSVCDPFADFTENKLYSQYRVAIDITGPEKYRTPVCQPDTTSIANLDETGVGCESFHFNYEGYSLGATKIIRTDNSETIRACTEAGVRYEHFPEATDWQRDDANLRAFPIEALYINLPSPAGKTLVEQATVREGSTPTDYTLLRSYLKNTSVEYLDGSCSGFQNRDTIEVYTRPDGTEYDHNAGAASPLGPNNACSNQNSPFAFDGDIRNVATGSRCDFRTSCGGEDGSCSTEAYNSVYNVVGEYSGTHQVNREDGAVISTDSATKEYTCTGICGGGGPGHCPAVAPNSAAEQFYIELGWN